MRSQTLHPIAVLLLLSAMPLTASPEAAGPPEVETLPTVEPSREKKPRKALTPTARTPWETLVFSTSKLGLTATSEIHRGPFRGPEGTGRVAGGGFSSADAHGESLVLKPSSFLSIESRYSRRVSFREIWFDDHGALSRSFSGRESGKSSYWNERTYQEQGVQRHRRAPANTAQALAERESWTHIEHHFEPYPQGWQQCSGLADPAILLHLLGEDLDAVRNLCFLSKGGLWTLTVTERPEQAALQVEYLDSRQGREKTVRQVRRSRKIEVRPKQLPGSTSEGSFRLLGVQGNLVISFDAQDGLPVELSGRVPFFGRVNVTLSAVR